MASAAKASETVTVIRPTRGFVPLDLAELVAHREFLFFLVWRDIKVRYRQTLLGALWAVLQPALTMVVFSIVFGRLAKVPSDGVPYPLFAFAGLLPWQLFAHALSESGNSLVTHQHLLSKVYFPRLFLPLSAVIAGLVDFALSFAVFLGMMAWYGFSPGPAIALLPLWILMAIASALAAGVWLSALNVEYRDVRYTIPFLTQFWMFVTPIAYPSSLLPEAWRTVYGLNPMAGVVEGFRQSLLGVPAGAAGSLQIASALSVTVMLVTGIFYFRRMERTFADVV